MGIKEKLFCFAALGQNMNRIKDLLKIDFPMIMAPMFLVTNEAMMSEAMNSGIAGCIPALNYRTIEELKTSLKQLRTKGPNGLGVNLIVNKSNTKYKEQLYASVDAGVDFFITSLGSPKEVIELAHKNSIKVFCDVVDEEYAKKVSDLGADALIAVNSGAGGHAGKIPATVLIPMLKKSCSLPIISAGGVATGEGILASFALGAEGLSIGSPFIASKEASINNGYKKACVDYGANDIVLTSKLSGTPCTVINTPYVKKIGTDQNMVETFLNKNKQIKKYAKMLTFYKGMKLLEKAAFNATYKSVWCAGPSIEFTEDIQSVREIVEKLTSSYFQAKEDLSKNLI